MPTPLKALPVEQIEISLIEVAPQIRKFSWGDVEELGRMIRAHGWCAPLMVTKSKGEKPWVLVAGERRLRAAEHIGWLAVPCQVVPGDKAKMLQLQENLGRQDLHWLEIGAKLSQWMAEGISSREAARSMGCDDSYVRRMVRAYESLAPENLEYIVKGRHRPPLERALIWVAYQHRPEKQREEIDRWLGTVAAGKSRRGGKAPANEHRTWIRVETVRRVYERARARKASRLVLSVLKYLLGESRYDPFKGEPVATKLPVRPKAPPRKRPTKAGPPQPI